MCCLVLAFQSPLADATITWTTPASGTGSASVAENAAVGQNVITLAATSNDNLGAFTLITTGTPFALATTGALTVSSATLDFETTPKYTLEIQAVDGSTTSTATITVTVTDVDETPTFSAASFSKCVIDKSPAGTTVTTLTANDPESGTLTYAISNANTNADFTMTSPGAIVKTTKILDKATKETYNLVITAADASATATATLVVTVEDTCAGGNGASFPAVSLTTLILAALLSI